MRNISISRGIDSWIPAFVVRPRDSRRAGIQTLDVSSIYRNLLRRYIICHRNVWSNICDWKITFLSLADDRIFILGQRSGYPVFVNNYSFRNRKHSPPGQVRDRGLAVKIKRSITLQRLAAPIGVRSFTFRMETHLL